VLYLFLEVCPKKLKFDEDSQLEKPLDTSKKLNKLKEKLKQNFTDDDDFNEANFNMARQQVFRRPLFGYDMLNVTSAEGDRVFLKLAPDMEHEKSTVSSFTHNSPQNSPQN